MKLKIGLGADHAGYRYKEVIKRYLLDSDYDVYDFGTHSKQEVDYPVFVRPVAKQVAQGRLDRGIVFGGSGNGEAMVANRIPGVRCALCWNVASSRLGRQHNNANMLSIGERMISRRTALKIVAIFLGTPFTKGRHLHRVRMIDLKR